MSKTAFAQTIIDKLQGAIGTSGESYNPSTPMSANQAIAQGITEYLTKNTQINVTYVGVIPGTPPTPDNTTDQAKVVGACIPPSGTDFDSWVKSIESGIVGGLMLAPGTGLVTPVGTIPAFLPGLVIPQSALGQAHQGNTENPQLPVWEVICDYIITWLTGPGTIPTYPATHLASTGVATRVSTIIQ